MKLKLITVLIIATLLSGCGVTSLFDDASTRLEIEDGKGLKAHYKSPKDQYLEYDPATGKIVIKSTTNAELAAQSAQAQANANRAVAEAIKAVAEKVPNVK